MTDKDVLVQRFVDQELTAEERLHFIVRLGREKTLRRRVIELEQLVLQAGQLPRPFVPDGFVASVMARTAHAVMLPETTASEVTASKGTVPGATALEGAAVGGAAWRRLAQALWAPRAVQWNLASAFAAGLVLVVAGGLIGTAVVGRRVQGSVAETAATPIAGGVALVRLVVQHPGARTVHVAGDFNGWNSTRTPLEPTAGGAWTVTIPLDPGRYEYMFVVDGEQWIADPFATEHADDGFGAQNAVLEVLPPSGGTL
jgi:hypothetical protein